ncbi:WD domain-containing protein, putative [Eimeria mitis]|uniref:WD domain-containing protein, putative n=1 Tax=Eimeria mitis TaxID=44415 RepID=U6K7E6_9EIME|nr:WD domain-containing protein, putative [Eimeria mitis]CDJ31398.1 WD domain-containing protein, putative [Eimeria mitis]
MGPFSRPFKQLTQRVSPVGHCSSNASGDSRAPQPSRPPQTPGPAADPTAVSSSGVSPHPGRAAPKTPQKNAAGPPSTVQDVCGAPEDLTACDIVRDGVCIISGGYLRLMRRRRWRGRRRPLKRAPGAPPEPRWVQGLRIISGGDIEVRGAVIKCRGTAAAAEQGTVWDLRRRLRRRGGPLASSKSLRRLGLKGRGVPAGAPPASKGAPTPTQRIELCARGSIRLLGPAVLHCSETLLWAGDSVTVGEAAEVTASATVSLRGPPSPRRGPRGPSAAAAPPSAADSSFAALAASPTLDSVAAALRQQLALGAPSSAVGPGAPGGGSPWGPPHQPGVPLSPSSAKEAVSAASAPAEVQSEAGGPQGALQQEAPEDPYPRGGSHGGLGGVLKDRCTANAFSNPVRAPAELRGDVFLPLVAGEAGVVYRGGVGGPLGSPHDGWGAASAQEDDLLGAPKGGGLVVVVAGRQLSVEGQISAAGEPGWGCEVTGPSPSKGSRQAAGGAPGPHMGSKGWRGSAPLKTVFRSLLGRPSGGSGPTEAGAAGAAAAAAAAATCATAGSGGSIVLVGESVVFPSPMRSGRVSAAGGGCIRGRPDGWEGAGGPSGAPQNRVRGPQEVPEALGGLCAAGGGGRIAIYAEQPHPLDPVVSRQKEVLKTAVRVAPSALLLLLLLLLVPEALGGLCAAGGGGRIAIYAEQPHPLDPVVLAPGGCALRSSRLDLLPCLCGGGGTIFSRAHRRLIVANKLTAVAAAAAAASAAAAVGSPGPRGQPASPHAFDSKPKEGQEAGAGTPLSDARDAALGTPVDAALTPLEGAPGGAPTGVEALAVLSVQPTPLPVPLYAPTLTLAVEAAVVTLRGRAQGGFGWTPEAAQSGGPSQLPADPGEAKVVLCAARPIAPPSAHRGRQPSPAAAQRVGLGALRGL